MAKELTVEVFADGAWQDAYSLKFETPLNPREGGCITGYLTSFYLNNMEYESSYLEHSVSVVHRLDMNIHTSEGYPAFLLERFTPSPIDHMRIKQSLPYLDEGEPMGFTRTEVAERNTDFLEYAYEQGAAIGGATGAGGEAPKLLLAEDHNGLMFAEATLSAEQTKQHWFVKFSRNRAAAVNKGILRAEFQYYRAITEVGMNTISTDALALIDDGEHKPSLWMPRFDREVTEQGILRHPVESIYSVCDVTENGAYLRHEFVLGRLGEIWSMAGQGDELFDLAVEYISRDLLNGILGVNQERFAMACKISKRALSQLEVDSGNPTLATLEAVFKKFGLKISLSHLSPVDLNAAFAQKNKAGFGMPKVGTAPSPSPKSDKPT